MTENLVEATMATSDELVLSTMMNFVIGIARLAHTSDWDSMSRNLDDAFKKFGYGSEAQNTQKVADALRYYLPQIKDMMKITYDPNRDKMLANLEEAINFTPSSAKDMAT